MDGSSRLFGEVYKGSRAEAMELALPPPSPGFNMGKRWHDDNRDNEPARPFKFKHMPEIFALAGIYEILSRVGDFSQILAKDNKKGTQKLI